MLYIMAYFIALAIYHGILYSTCYIAIYLVYLFWDLICTHVGSI